MFKATSASLGFHALIILLLGMVVGFPYGSQIVAHADESAIRAWRVAHLEGLGELRRLVLRDCYGITGVGVQRIKKALPQCYVSAP